MRAAVLAQPVRSKTCSTPRDLRYALAEADASFKSNMQARGTDWVARSNGRGQIARSPTVKPLGFSYLSDLASSYPPRLPLECCAVFPLRSPHHSPKMARRVLTLTGVPALKDAPRSTSTSALHRHRPLRNHDAGHGRAAAPRTSEALSRQKSGFFLVVAPI